jgi:hypothetical protein
VDQLALSSFWKVQVPQEHIARVEAAPVIVAVPTLAVALLAPVVVTLAWLLVVRWLVLTSEDEPLVLMVMNSIDAFARIHVAWTEVDCHRMRPTAAIGHQPKRADESIMRGEREGRNSRSDSFGLCWVESVNGDARSGQPQLDRRPGDALVSRVEA